MARHASTYRQNRRAQYLSSQERIDGMGWAEFNTYSRKQEYNVGHKPTTRLMLNPDRSKYMPHIGAKQRAKGAK